MKVTVEELQNMRATLTAHRLEHETLVTQMQVLRQNCQELRAQLAKANAARRAGKRPPVELLYNV